MNLLTIASKVYRKIQVRSKKMTKSDQQITDLAGNMTLEEKAGLCSGKGLWWTKEILSRGIPSIMMADGPHGLRKQKTDNDNMDLTSAIPATCFPTAAGLAASWNRKLLQEVGKALAEECRAEGVSILLGPGVNIKRHPLCGRNFEYFSEDPYLAGELAKNYIQALQQNGVGASVKHYAANNQETHRMTVDTLVDERTLREIYLPAFEVVVKESRPWTIMCAYNRLNGTYCSENRWLLTEVLKNEWGHEGVVVTDWGACNDRVEGLRAGLELEMPGNGGLNDAEIVKAVRDGRLDESVLDKAVKRLLKLIFTARDAAENKKSYDQAKHHDLARKIAAETMVLVKNEDAVLPLKNKKRIGFFGAFAKNPRYQGAGSSHINPTMMDSVIEEAGKLAEDTQIVYADGYPLKNDKVDNALLKEAVEFARTCDAVVVFAGLPDSYESEGFDRKHMSMPDSHIRLIEGVAEVNANLVVVLSNGSPVEMLWINRVKAVLESYLAGQAWGGAVADILFGRVNPSGKLAESFPLRLEDCPSFLHFPGKGRKVLYAESLFVGYRYYDSCDKDILFPFGHGLSYTSFEYSDLSISNDGMKVAFNLRNTGPYPGYETAQIYIRDKNASVVRPQKELKGFEKVWLEPGEKKSVEIALNSRSYAFWDEDLKDWYIEGGDFEIMIGSSSRDIRLNGEICLPESQHKEQVYGVNSEIHEIVQHPELGPVIQSIIQQFKQLFGSYENGTPEASMIDAMVDEMPLRNMVTFSSGTLLSKEQLALLIEVLNGDKPASKFTSCRD
jgi:beta-glucosidase